MAMLILPFLRSPASLPLGCWRYPRARLVHALRPLNCSASKPSRSAPKSSKPSGPRANNPLLKPLQLSPALQNVVGVSELSRAETIKRIWAYIKENHLQSETSKRVIVCDEKLKAVFGQDSLNFLEISKLLSPHFIKE